jgi:hypothetical protein
MGRSLPEVNGDEAEIVDLSGGSEQDKHDKRADNEAERGTVI